MTDMKAKKLLILWILLVLSVLQSKAQTRKLWYTKPADESARSENVNKATTGRKFSREALPLGNGRLGCMPYGGIQNEFVEFNEDSLWIGDENFTGAYQAFGAFEVLFENPAENVQAYRRALDIETAVHAITYRADGVNYRREYFVSHPADVMVFRFTADRKGRFSAVIRMEDAHKAIIAAKGNRITSTGDLSGYVKKKDRQKTDQYALVLEYEAGLQVLHEGGTLQVSGDKLLLKNADSFTILLAAGTDFVLDRSKGWKGEHPHARIAAQLDRAASKPYQELLREHVTDYQALYKRFDLDLGSSPDALADLPSDERIEQFKTGGKQDPDFQELIYQYARYLILSCSRPGGLPANLQGLWNVVNYPNWSSDYHTDVNIQMNYWFVDQANLPECFEPFSDWLFEMRKARIAKMRKEKPELKGWEVDGATGLVGGEGWHIIPGCASWMVQNAWDHYAFTQNKTYLRETALPMIKEMCEYWESGMTENENGQLVTLESKSPESGPVMKGVTFCQSLAWDAFNNFIEGSEDLETDAGYREKVIDMKHRLMPPGIGEFGQLKEWPDDAYEKERFQKHGKTNRHLSHMVGVHPGRQISPLTTPELAEAARVSMQRRANSHTTWGRVQRSMVWARLHEPQKAWQHFDHAFERFLPNLLSYIEAPCFQIDANFGYAAAVNEMLLQSHLGELHLLPCLPEAWPEGSVQGMKARGNFIIDQMSWNDSKLARAEITSVAGGPCKLRTNSPVQVHSNGKTVSVEKLDDGAIRFPTKIGETFTITPK